MAFPRRKEGTVCAQRYRKWKKEHANTTEDKQHPAAFPAKALMMCKKPHHHPKKKNPTQKNPP